MSCSRHKIRLAQPVRDVRVRYATETLISERKLHELLDEQYRSGFEAGQKALREQLLEQRQQLIELQSGVLRSIERALPTVIADCERAVVLLALESARRVVHQLPITPETVEASVKAALTELQDTAAYEVRLNPEDLALLEGINSGLLPAAAQSKSCFTSDTGVPRGGCVIRTQHGSIDATRETMFERLEAAVLC